MNVKIVYDGDCPFCNEYVRYQKLRNAVDTLELIDARARPEALQELGLTRSDLEDGMVVYADGAAHRGADAVHLLSMLSESPARWWVRAVAAASRTRGAARLLYPALKLGRRIALAALGIPRLR